MKDFRDRFVSDEAATAGNTFCIAKVDNDVWRKSGRKDSSRSIGEEYKANIIVSAVFKGKGGDPHLPAASLVTENVQIQNGQGEKRIATPVTSVTGLQ